MNDQLPVFDQCTGYRANHQRDYRNALDTTNPEEHTMYGTHHILCGRIPDESKKLTSAALRSPVMIPFDKRVGGYTTYYSDNERIGELPQPTPLGYEQFRYQQHSHTSLFSTPPSTTIIKQDTLLSSNNPQKNKSSYHPIISASVDTIVRSCAIHHCHQQQQQPQVIYDGSPVTIPTFSGSHVISSASSGSLISNTSTMPPLTTSNSDNSNNINIVVQSPIENQTTSPISPKKNITIPSIEDKENTKKKLRPKGNNATKLLSESLSYALTIANNPSENPKRYAVAKISNVRIPWSVSIHDIEELFNNPELGIKLPSKQETAQYVHIIIDKSSGKTLSEAYVEFESEHDISKVLQKVKTPHVKTRRVYITRSSSEQLFRAVFPRWCGAFINDIPSTADKQNPRKITAPHLSSIIASPPPPPPPFVEGQEYDSLLAVCRNFKLHFSRKCAERPFENFISMIVKFPWEHPTIITTMQRDHLYEYYKLATGVLHDHLGKPNNQIDRTLMPRMVRAAIMCLGLTIPQKKGILIASGILCPTDLVHLIEPTVEDELSSFTSSSLDEHHQETSCAANLFSELSISGNAD
ncbi:hypothetical protein INT45_007663 [Circinella minor]|uniref:RRM domain-containing protein n=1 Tax=Circinella minor TaxID=1195481 RepID=A0A8H7S021_9FUNG|nr:hypothetical protein INT45_007663 [Circinella minor]